MRRILSTLMLLGLSSFLFSQTNQAEAKKRLEALKGTYELKQLTRDMPTIPENLADLIEQNRQATEVKHLILSPNLELIIYPKSNIAGTGK